MIRNPSLKKVLKWIQLARIVNEKAISPQALLETKDLLSRRDLLKLAGKTAAVLPFSNFLAHPALAKIIQAPMKNSEPVIILGGGTAGLTTAYRLQKVGIPCAIYEASNRIGGRMLSASNFNSDGMFCELGGELVDSDHEDLMQLCTELNLGIQNLQEGDAGLKTDLYYADGRLIQDSEMLFAFQPLAAQISSDLKEIFGDTEVKMPTYKDQKNPTWVKYDQIPLSEYLYSKKDVEKWVLDLIQVLYVCEYGQDLDQQSALNFLTLISTDTNAGLKLLGDSDESKRIVGGSSKLPLALEKAIQDRVPIYFEHELVKISDGGRNLKLIFIKDKTTFEISTSQLVCTIPFSVLRNVEGVSKLDLGLATQECIQKMGYGANSKRIIGFKNKIWRNQIAGNSTLENPTRGNSNGALLTLTHQQFWETSRMQPGKSGILTQFLGGSQGQQIMQAPLHSSLDCLNQTFPGISAAFDGNIRFGHWPENPWSKGSYICLKPGQYTSMHGLAAESSLSDRLFFAGEHTSIEFSGFMNGAVQSGNRVSRQIISLRGLQNSKSQSTRTDLTTLEIQ